MPRGAGAEEELPEVHETAQAVNPAARCAYVDTDPVVFPHSRVHQAPVRHGEDLVPSEDVAVVRADLREPGNVLADQEVTAVIDLTEPVCFVFGLVLHFLDLGDAREVTAGYVRRMVPRSLLVVSSAYFSDEDLAKQLSAEYTAQTWYNHSPADVESLFAGLDLVQPGITEAHGWRGGMPAQRLRHRDGHVLAGTARKPP